MYIHTYIPYLAQLEYSFHLYATFPFPENMKGEMETKEMGETKSKFSETEEN
jgi:hypothetical protein